MFQCGCCGRQYCSLDGEVYILGGEDPGEGIYCDECGMGDPAFMADDEEDEEDGL